MGLVFRLGRFGLSSRSMTLLYKSLVRPILEYASSVWSPYQLGKIDNVQSIQRRFVRILGVRDGYAYRDVPIDNIEASLGLQSLASRRHVADLLFLHKLINGGIDCPLLLQLVDFRIPTTTRSHNLFEIRFRGSNYLRHSAFPRMLRAGNGVCELVDFFSDSVERFKRLVLSLAMNGVV